MKKILYILTFAFALSATAVAQEPETAVNRVVIGGEYFYVHTVQPGETLFSLSRKYNVQQNDIIRNNPHTAEGMRAGEAIKIPAPEPEPLPRNIRNRTTSNRRIEVHVVNPGETAYSIAKRYAISIDDMIDANPELDPTRLSIGQRILVPRNIIGSLTQSEIDAGFSQYTEALSEVSDGWAYHWVEKGETLYSLIPRLNTPEDTLRKYNPAELADGLKAGSMLRYPVAKREPAANDVTVTDPEPDAPPVYDEVESKTFDTSRPLQVALLLPFTANGREEASMADYYYGTLLALRDLKNAGVSVNLSVYDTRRSAQEVRRILRNNELSKTDLIIGPRYEEVFEEASRFAYRERIPIVSPQSLVESGNPFVYQVRPAPEHQYDKLKPFLTADHNVVLISPSAGTDQAFLTDVGTLLPGHVKRITYSRSDSSSAIEKALSLEKENVIIVPTTDENTTDAILATISTIQNTLTSRTRRGYSIQIIGSPQWARFRNNDKELFFKLRAMYLTIYYADRTHLSVSSFDQEYLSSFGTLPSLFSYRGYDVAKLFITAIHSYGDRYAESINRANPGLLQVPYHFRRDESGKWINDEWVLVRYRNDYLIDVR